MTQESERPGRRTADGSRRRSSTYDASQARRDAQRRSRRRQGATESEGPERTRARHTSSDAARRQGQTRRSQTTRQAPQGARHEAARRQQRPQGTRSGTRQPAHATPQRRRRTSPVPFIIGGVAVLAVFLFVFFFFIHPMRFDITVNGETMNVARHTTLNDLVEDGVVNPTPGNLLAIDQTLLETGGGDAFAATVDGVATNDGTVEVEPRAVIEIGDGADVTETYSETQETIAHGQRDTNTEFADYFDRALHIYSEGQDGVTVTRTGDVSGKVVTEEVTPMIDAGYHTASADVGDQKICALTFDDGPWGETTKEILDILQDNGAVATFFTIGNQIEGNEDVVLRAVEQGCEVCTHTWDHAAGSGGGTNLTYMSADEQIEEVQRGLQAIEDVTGTPAPKILRAPGGNFYGDIIDTMRDYLDAEIGWEVDTEDWSRPGSDAIYLAIMSVKPGQVILMHDGGGDRSQTVDALSRALPELVSEGWSFVTISELLTYAN